MSDLVSTANTEMGESVAEPVECRAPHFTPRFEKVVEDWDLGGNGEARKTRPSIEIYVGRGSGV